MAQRSIVSLEILLSSKETEADPTLLLFFGWLYPPVRFWDCFENVLKSALSSGLWLT